MKDVKYEQYQQAKLEGLQALTSYSKRNNALYSAYSAFERIDAGIVKADDESIPESTRTAYSRWKAGLSYSHLIDGLPRSGSKEDRIGHLTVKQAEVAYLLSMRFEGSGSITDGALKYAESLKV